MNDRETSRYNTFGRTKTFGTDNAGDFAPASEAIKRFDNVSRIIADLDREKANQQGGSATALRLDLRNVARTATALSQDEPGLADKFPMPDSTQGGVLTSADAYWRNS